MVIMETRTTLSSDVQDGHVKVKPTYGRRSERLQARSGRLERGDQRSIQRTKFVVDVLGGTRRTAELMDVDPSQPSRWASGQSLPMMDTARLLVDLDHVLSHAVLVWDGCAASDWLTTPNERLDGARPLDHIKLHGTSAVVNALQEEAAGSFA